MIRFLHGHIIKTVLMLSSSFCIVTR